jgi:3-oxoacyl-[acyl-carrier protein] reductase
MPARGNIVNIGSTAGVNGMRQGTIYSSSKFALRGLSECWKAELRRDNVRVFQINPSEVRTSFGTPDGTPKEEIPSKLRGQEIAHTIHSLLTMDDRGFIPELNIIATNP